MCTTCGCGGDHQHPPSPLAPARKRRLSLEVDILAANNRVAADNRRHFAGRNILTLNLVSSPGAGKTTLLTATLKQLNSPAAVIEGDQQTALDAERIRACGVPAVQINTGQGCHLDAPMVQRALAELPLAEGSLLFIENVGNLVCPAPFDLGEAAKVVILSVTEGDDKPLKYPDIFAAARLMVIGKIDLLPYVDFEVARCVEYARRCNPAIEVVRLSARSGEGMADWLGWIERQRDSLRGAA